jgi:hypothetical protein
MEFLTPAFAKPEHPYQLWLARVMTGVCWILVATAVVGRNRGEQRRTDLLIFAWTAGTLILVFVLSQYKSVWSTRYLLPIAPGLYYLIGVGLLEASRQSKALALGAGVFTFTVILASVGTAITRPGTEDWRGAAQWIARQATPNDLVIVCGEDYQVIWAYYYRGPAPTYYFYERRTANGVDRAALASALEATPPHSGDTWAVLRRNPPARLFNTIETDVCRFFERTGSLKNEFRTMWLNAYHFATAPPG